jgi:hypothetical protein
LWRAFWQKAAPANEISRRVEAATRSLGQDNASDQELLARARDAQARELTRVARIVRRALAELYGLEGDLAYWGFKEIWVGAEPWQSWEPFDAVYPDAFYVHLIRHPLEFVRSNAAWNRRPLTLDLLRVLLEDWVAYVRKSRERRATDRYAEIRYEDLTTAPASVLSSLFAQLGLAPDPACLVPLETLWLPSMRRSGWPQGMRAALGEIPGLEAAMAELGYQELAFDDAPPIDPDATLVARRVEGRTDVWRLEPPFLKDEGVGWQAPLLMEPQLNALGRVADNLDYPERSPLRLLEDGKPLGPAHAMHRQDGKGRYSHWSGNALLFSTSDNSDPNRNGREYTIEWRLGD